MPKLDMPDPGMSRCPVVSADPQQVLTARATINFLKACYTAGCTGCARIVCTSRLACSISGHRTTMQRSHHRIVGYPTKQSSRLGVTCSAPTLYSRAAAFVRRVSPLQQACLRARTDIDRQDCAPRIDLQKYNGSIWRLKANCK